MASSHDIIAEEWRTRAPELATWAMEHLINRQDVWGQYSVLTPSERRQSNRSYKAMTLPARGQRDKARVTIDKLTRHFASRRDRKPQLIGLHAKSKSGTSRWLGIDIDCHDTDAVDAEDLGRRNLVAAVRWYRQLQTLGYDPLLFDSNGAGGFHLWVLFAEPAPTQTVYDFAMALLADWQAQHLDRLPETFPKAVKPDSLGSWFRLPGLHHTRAHHSRVWAGDDGLDEPWLTGHAAIDVMLACLPGPAPDRSALPERTRGSSHEASSEVRITRRTHRRRSRPSVCVDLDGVLAIRTGSQAIGAPMDGAVEFTRSLAQQADIIVYTARFATRSGKPRSPAAIARLHTRISRWLERNGMAYTSICSTVAKPIASAYVDDRAVHCQPETQGVQAFDTALEAIDVLHREY